ncbi:MAG: protein kinase [Pseudomonadota bacterium]
MAKSATSDRIPSSGLVPLAPEDVVELPFAPGEIIGGKYEIIGLIGTGGMGYVVSAMHVELGERVALKFLRQEALANSELVGRFAREAQAAVKIKSEYVARVFDVGTLPDGVPFIVMEHLEGKDLADVLREKGPLPIRVAVEYVMQACEALASAHSNGIVHRDIKPENLFLARQAQGMEIIKILDFGISKVALTGVRASNARQFVRTELPMGSPVYMSPEQIRTSAEVDARTDIWSLGCVLFEVLTGHTPFEAPTLMQLGAAILEQEPRRLREFLPDAPPELEAVVARCLEKDVRKRYQNVAELAVALYPFAPRRARISAERCSYLLGSTPNGGALDLSSVAPPPGTEEIGARTGRSNTAPSVTFSELSAMQRGKRMKLLLAATAALSITGAGFALWKSDAAGPEITPAAQAKPAPAPAREEARAAAPVRSSTPTPAQLAAPPASPESSTETPEPAAEKPEVSASPSPPKTKAASPPAPQRAKPKPAAPRPRPSARPTPTQRAAFEDELDVGF